MNDYRTSSWSWESNPGSLQEQKVLLALSWAISPAPCWFFCLYGWLVLGFGFFFFHTGGWLTSWSVCQSPAMRFLSILDWPGEASYMSEYTPYTYTMYWHLDFHVSPKSVVWKDLFIGMDKCTPKRIATVFVSLIHLVIPIPMHLAASKNWNSHNKQNLTCVLCTRQTLL